MFLITKNEYLAYALLFFGEIALNLNWAIVADILLYVVLPNRRSTAEAFRILISRAFGDASSPYLIGLISEYLKIVLNQRSESQSDSLTDFESLQYALLITCFVEIIGGVFFLFASKYISEDKRRVEETVSGSQMNNVILSQSIPLDQTKVGDNGQEKACKKLVSSPRFWGPHIQIEEDMF